MKKNFTLPEIVLSLGIVFICITSIIIPCIEKIQTAINNYTINSTYKQLKQALKTMDENRFQEYDSTISFANDLSKYINITKICNSNDIMDCWPYEEIIVDIEGNTTKVSQQTNGKKAFHKLSNQWGETVGLVINGKYPMIISYKKNCQKEEGNLEKCIAGVWDINGEKGKNTLGMDVITFNTDIFGKAECLFKSKNFCITSEIKSAEPLKIEEYCEIADNKLTVNSYGQTLGIKNCCTDSSCIELGDYWAGAVKECKGTENLPTKQELKELAEQLYSDINISKNENLNISKIPMAIEGIGTSYKFILTGEEINKNYANHRHFEQNSTSEDKNGVLRSKGGYSLTFFCVDREK